MNEFAKWREGKPLILTGLAETIVSSADLLFEAMQALRSVKGLPRLSPPPSVPEWMKLYRQHHRLANMIGREYGFGESPDAPTASEFFAAMRKMSRLAKTDPDALKRVLETALAADPEGVSKVIHDVREVLQQAHNADMKASATGTEEHDDDYMTWWTSTPEVQFFLRVWFPCYMEYRCYPVELLWDARGTEGKTYEDDALEDLLRLDKSVIFEPRIAEKLHRAYHSDGRKGYRRIMKALSGRLRGEVTRRKVKSALGGLISDFARAMKVTVTETEIRDLFDAYARSQGQGKLIDPDLPRGKWTLSKAIQRQRKRWRESAEEREKRGQNL